MRTTPTIRKPGERGHAELEQVLLQVCKAVADPLRLEIVRVLRSDSFGVQELAGIFAVPQPLMSHHLKILSKAGLLGTQRQGNSIFYRRSLLARESPGQDFTSSLFENIDRLPLGEDLQARIQKIYSDRAAQSRLFFERHVDKFREQQGQLCELEQYLPQLREVIDIMALPKQCQVMEVGPGEGHLLLELAERFERLVAVDSSEEMLRLAQVAMSGCDRVRFVRDSLETYAEVKPEFDAIILNMVLHHMPSPQQVFVKAKQLLQAGGFLLITDLCLHNQEWTRASCGDVWLGFDPEDLRAWARQEGFREIQNLYLGLKNGFQIQIRLFGIDPI